MSHILTREETAASIARDTLGADDPAFVREARDMADAIWTAQLAKYKDDPNLNADSMYETCCIESARMLADPKYMAKFT